tara:strand:- start:180 stop:389 length:210 start_codon:yes stop_codon:yes gene_type:complete
MAELISAIGLVSAAAVTGIFSMIASRFRRENTEQHAASIQKLDDIQSTVTEISHWQKDHQQLHDNKGES